MTMAANNVARWFALSSLWAAGSFAFVHIPTSPFQRQVSDLRQKQSWSPLYETVDECELDPSECAKFKILTCSATSCAKKRKNLGVDEFATLGSLWERKELANAVDVQIEESTCLGSCKVAPCVAVEHEDFVGSVSLEGMTPAEFKARAFHSVITEDDVDRVWSSVERAIKIMAGEEADEAAV
uniref:Uncharacterized protein n=1 Tax=Pseudictyota dubia TaxID=2749911 RepID=A0A7R9WAP4_9STRA|mmetsp:Transcript_4087/g.7184  ORF Transcript_4087/g.7184 Transcript_4087/m.7184 type:complete len:183 (+) Transcript_4087:223-771(+)